MKTSFWEMLKQTFQVSLDSIIAPKPVKNELKHDIFDVSVLGLESLDSDILLLDEEYESCKGCGDTPKARPTGWSSPRF